MTSYIRIKRICTYCNSEFVAKTTTTKYCSAKCAKRAYKERKRGEKITAVSNDVKMAKGNSEVQEKHFLTVKEASQLLSCSQRSIYRYINSGKIKAINLGERMLRIRRSDIDKLFEANTTYTIKPIKAFDVTKCYSIGQVQKKYNISEKTLFEALKRNQIQKMQRGKYVYVQQKDIDKLLGNETN